LRNVIYSFVDEDSSDRRRSIGGQEVQTHKISDDRREILIFKNVFNIGHCGGLGDFNYL
jgi:hypothetical protein